MKRYDFDKIINRYGTQSLKYDCAKQRGRPEDILPLWVADMDFRAPDEVTEALCAKANHGIFGYSEPDDGYFAALEHWFLSRHGWKVCGRDFVLTCGVVYSICTFVRALTKEGDGVLVCQPVYYPFSEAVESNRRKLVVSELNNNDGYYTVNFEDFEKKIAENNVKLFLLCSPHNPVGRVWTAEELRRMGEICLRYGVFVVSDEIHADFIYGKRKHLVFPTVDKRFAENCAVCTAPTKTFNLAGLHIANTYIPNPAVRRKFVAEVEAHGYSQSNVMGIVGCQAAYTYGSAWLDQLLPYLERNVRYIKEYLAAHVPEIRLCEPEGTYLVWLDCRELGEQSVLEEILTNRVKLWLDAGSIFGKGGDGFMRINAACPRATLHEALRRLEKAAEIIGKEKSTR